MVLKRLSSGIKGLDNLIQGGFLENSIILIAGKAGTGKTLFCASFLYEGLKNKESGIFVTTEENIEEIKEDVYATFNWDFEKFEKENLLRFIEIEPTFSIKKFEVEKEIGNIIRIYIQDLILKISEAKKEINAKRLVIDSITIIENLIKDDYLRRASLSFLIKNLKKIKLTTLITSTIPTTNPNSLSISGVIEFLVDGIIKLDYNPREEELKRTLEILKMRRTKHSEYVHAFEFTSDGIKIIGI